METEENKQPEDIAKREETAKKKHISNIIYYKITIALSIMVLIAMSYGLFLAYDINSDAKETIESELELARPAEIEITIIDDKTCDECSRIEDVLNDVKQANVKVTKENLLDYSESAAKEMVSKYNIKKLPTIVITGETEKAGLSGFSSDNNALILTQVNPPYIDIASNEIKGIVSAIVINAPSCDECFNVSTALDQLEAVMNVGEKKTLKYSDKESRLLMEKYSINILPTFILSEDVFEYKEIDAVLKTLGTKEGDNSYVLRSVAAPYYNVSSKNIAGRVKAIFLTDKSCTTCYNASIHKNILARFNLVPYKEDAIDIASETGKSLIEKYNITSVPTIILSKEANAYNTLNSIWPQVGSIEEDGSYIFRNIDVMKETYKNLATNKTIEFSN